MCTYSSFCTVRMCVYTYLPPPHPTSNTQTHILSLSLSLSHTHTHTRTHTHTHTHTHSLGMVQDIGRPGCKTATGGNYYLHRTLLFAWETRLQDSGGRKGIVHFCDLDRVQCRFVVRLRLGRVCVSVLLGLGFHTVFERACARGWARAHALTRTHARTRTHNAYTRT